MKILIVGGTGLISTAITRELHARGEEVILYNRGESAAELPAGVRHVRGDRTDAAALARQAAEAGPFDCVIDMVGYEPAEAEGAIRAFQGRTGQYVFCSTVDVYTKPAPAYPVREDAERRPAASFPYAWKKGRCEELLWAAHARGDLPVTVVRPAHTYGEGRGLVETFGARTLYFDRLRKGKPIVVHGDGTSFWVSCHRDDVARAFAAAAGNPPTVGNAYHVAGED